MSLIFHIFSRRYTIQSISAISRAPCIRQIGAAERCRTPCNDAGQANSVSTSICLDRSPAEFNYGYMNKHTFFFYPRTSSGSRQKESNKWDCLARSRLYFYLKSIQHKYWIISIVSCFGQLLCFHNKSGIQFKTKFKQTYILRSKGETTLSKIKWSIHILYISKKTLVLLYHYISPQVSLFHSPNPTDPLSHDISFLK